MRWKRPCYKEEPNDCKSVCHHPLSRVSAFLYNHQFLNGRLLLWDCDKRTYSYYIEVSLNKEDWEIVFDRSKVACRSWQHITFPRRPGTVQCKVPLKYICDHLLELALLEVELIVFLKSKYLVLLQLYSFELSELTTPPTRSSTAFTSNALQSAISEEVKILARTTRAPNTVPNLRSQHRQQRPAAKNRPGMRTLTTSTRMEQGHIEVGTSERGASSQTRFTIIDRHPLTFYNNIFCQNSRNAEVCCWKLLMSSSCCRINNSFPIVLQQANERRESVAVAAAASAVDQPSEDFESIYSRSSPNLSQHSGGERGGVSLATAMPEMTSSSGGRGGGRSGQGSLPVGASACSLANQVWYFLSLQ